MGQEIESFNQDTAQRINELAVLQFEIMDHHMSQSRINHLETLLQFQVDFLNLQLIRLG